MKTIVVSFLSVGLVVVLAGPSDAASKKRYRTYYYGGLSQAYPPQPKAYFAWWAGKNPCP